MKCPIGKKSSSSISGRCGSIECVYHSVCANTGCFHGTPISIESLAMHKGMTVKEVSACTSQINGDVLRTIRLFKYAEFCSEVVNPSKEDEWMWEHAKNTPPFNTPLFSFVTLSRYARMREEEAFAAFKQTGVVVDQTLEEFINWPFKKHKVAILSMELFL